MRAAEGGRWRRGQEIRQEERRHERTVGVKEKRVRETYVQRWRRAGEENGKGGEGEKMTKGRVCGGRWGGS